MPAISFGGVTATTYVYLVLLVFSLVHLKVSMQSVAKFDVEFQVSMLRVDTRFPGFSGYAAFWADGCTLSSSTWR